MKKPIIGSVAFHVAVLGVAYVGLPALDSDESMMDTPIVVDVVDVAERTNAPPPKTQPDPKPEPPKKAPPPPPPPKAEAPPPPPPPAQPKEEVAMAPPEPAPKPKAEPKPQPEPKAEAKPKPKVPPSLAQAQPRKKPKPPDLFASVLKTVEKLEPQARVKEPDKKAKKKPEAQENFEATIASALSSTPQRFNPSQRVTISEIDLVRRQIAQCWNLPAGAKDAQNLKTTIRVWMNVDGTVQKAELQDVARIDGNPFYRAVAESAVRAVLNRRCQPFKLPREKYTEWSTLTLNFDPKEMF